MTLKKRSRSRSTSHPPPKKKSLNLDHPCNWTKTTHYGMCGQSCPCCRTQIEGIYGFGTCVVCNDTLTEGVVPFFNNVYDIANKHEK